MQATWDGRAELERGQQVPSAIFPSIEHITKTREIDLIYRIYNLYTMITNYIHYRIYRVTRLYGYRTVYTGITGLGYTGTVQYIVYYNTLTLIYLLNGSSPCLLLFLYGGPIMTPAPTPHGAAEDTNQHLPGGAGPPPRDLPTR